MLARLPNKPHKPTKDPTIGNLGVTAVAQYWEEARGREGRFLSSQTFPTLSRATLCLTVSSHSSFSPLT